MANIATASDARLLTQRLAVAGVQVIAHNYNFVTAAEEEVFMATASDDEVFAYASAIAIGADNKVDEEKAAKFAKNKGFLKGLMTKVWKSLKKNGGKILAVGAVAGTIALVAAALRFIVKDPARAGAISTKFAAQCQEWAGKVGQLAAKAIQVAKQKGGAIKGFVMQRLANAVAVLKSVGGKLMSAAKAGAAKAGQAAKSAGAAGVSKAKNLAGQAGNAAKTAGKEATYRAGKAVNQAGQAVQRAGQAGAKKAFQAGAQRGGKLGRALQGQAGNIGKVGTKVGSTMRNAGNTLVRKSV